MSYLEMALRVSRKMDALNAGQSIETRSAPAPANPRAVYAEDSKRRELAACGSPHCAGCYDVGGARKIHPPRCGERIPEVARTLEPKGKPQ
jgi:hypothetical protein